MIQIIDKNKCTGCKMCADICPQGAISFETNAEGFWYPTSDPKKCINCGLCVEKCIVHKPLVVDTRRVAYEAYSRNDEIRRESTSGGVYYEMAKKVLSLGGYLVGSIYADDYYSAHHIISNNPDDLNRIMGSKYFQSDTAEIYKKTKEILDKDNYVLFTGLPCQVHALKVYLNKDYEKLVTLDLLCRGVPSPKMHMKKIQSYEEKAHCKVKSFRDKSKYVGWENFGELMTFQNGKTRFVSRWEDHINDCFIHKNLNIRESCYSCNFKDGNNASDLTTGDFWGITGQTEKDNIYGVSCLIANTEKGNQFINSISDILYLDRVDINDIKKGNPAYVEAVERPNDREKFYEIANIEGLNSAVNYFIDLGPKYRIKNLILKIKRKLIRHKFFIKNFFDIKILDFIKLNYFSENVSRYKEAHIYPMKGTLLQLDKDSRIELKGNLYLNYYSSYKKGKAETILRIEEGGRLIVKDMVVIAYGNTLSIDENATLETGYLRTGVNSNIICAHKMTFGQRVMIGRNVCIFDSDYHPIYNTDFKKINDNKEVIIGDNCWVGANSMILKGSKLGNGSIVSSNSMVMGNVEENKIFINSRNSKSLNDNVYWRV